MPKVSALARSEVNRSGLRTLTRAVVLRRSYCRAAPLSQPSFWVCSLVFVAILALFLEIKIEPTAIAANTTITAR